MEVLMLTLFVSLMLAGAGVAFFVWSVRTGAHEHADRLALLPIDSDGEVAVEEPPSLTEPPSLRDEQSQES